MGPPAFTTGPVEACLPDAAWGAEAALVEALSEVDSGEHDHDVAAKTASMTRVSELVRMVLSVIMMMVAVVRVVVVVPSLMEDNVDE